MNRDPTPLYLTDLTAFTRTLRAALAESPALPGHQAMMSLIARAAGYRNIQHLKAVAPAETAPDPRALRVFDAAGRMTRWPGTTRVQGHCCWVLWSRLPARRDLTEAEVNDVLKAAHTFGDHVLLRRSLIDHGLASRAQDGSCYRRIEQEPPPEARALIRAVGGR